MPDLVSEDADQFGCGVFFDEGVVESNFFVFAESGEKGVGFGGSFGAVHDGDFGEGEFTLFGHSEDLGFEFTVFEWGKFVEEREKDGGDEVLEEQ